MNIALLSVGTEILLGDTVNTNLASLGQVLYNSGFILSTEKTVPDDKKLIQDAVNELLENNDVIITCGGIGPTEDDFTKEVISEMFDLNLVVDEDHLSWMKSRWESRGMTMPATNVKQAEIPEGATKLNNTNGTSPGIYIEYKSKHVFILPGPPREFIPLVTDELVPFLEDNFTKVEKDYEFILFFRSRFLFLERMHKKIILSQWLHLGQLCNLQEVFYKPYNHKLKLQKLQLKELALSMKVDLEDLLLMFFNLDQI